MKYLVNWNERIAYSAEVEADSEESAIEAVKQGEFTDLAFEGDHIEFEDGSFHAILSGK